MPESEKNSIDDIVFCLTPCIQPNKKDVFVPHYLHWVLSQIISLSRDADSFGANVFPVSKQEDQVAESCEASLAPSLDGPVLLSQSSQRLSQPQAGFFADLYKRVRNHIYQYFKSRFGLLEPAELVRSLQPMRESTIRVSDLICALNMVGGDVDAPSALAQLCLRPRNSLEHYFYLEPTTHKDRLNRITQVYEVYEHHPDGSKTSMNLIVVMRPKTKYPAKTSFADAFEMNAAFYNAGGKVAEPVALIEDFPNRDISTLLSELRGLNLPLSGGAVPDNQPSGALMNKALELMLSMLDSYDRYEGIVTKKLKYLRSDKTFAWFETRIKNIESSCKKVKSRRNSTNLVNEKLLFVLRFAERYAFNRHLESLVETVANGAFKPGIFGSKCASSDEMDVRKYLVSEFKKAIPRLEQQAIAESDSCVGLTEIVGKMSYANHSDTYFNLLANLINKHGFICPVHGEVVLHHFAPDSEGVPRLYDFDKSKREFFLFYDLLTFINNVIVDTSYEQRQDYFLRSILFFTKLQLEHNSHAEDDPVIRPRDFLKLRTNLSLEAALEKLSKFSISDDSCKTGQFLDIFDCQQLNDLRDIFDLFSAAYYITLAGRSAKLRVEDSTTYADLMAYTVGIEELASRYNWVQAYYTSHNHRKNLIHHLKKKPGLVMGNRQCSLAEFVEEANKPQEVAMKDFYDDDNLRKTCAARMYDSLQSFLERHPRVVENIPGCPHDLESTSSPRAIVSNFMDYMKGIKVERTYTDSRGAEKKIAIPIPYFNQSKTDGVQEHERD